MDEFNSGSYTGHPYRPKVRRLQEAIGTNENEEGENSGRYGWIPPGSRAYDTRVPARFRGAAEAFVPGCLGLNRL
jgi:hypothetical protein